MLKTKIGFIGYSGHAARLIEIFEEIKQCEVSHFYHPEKDIDLKQISRINYKEVIATKNLEDLYGCDGIVISTPNHTHYNYLEKLVKNYRGYVFCEKPPVSSLKELNALKKLPKSAKQRIYFNFNMRFSFLSDVLWNFPSRFSLGEPVRIAIIAGHGLAFKKSYKSSWRADKNLHKTGVLETLGIHFFDLISFLFGSPSNLSVRAENYSPYGNSVDTCHVSCSFNNNCYFVLTCSYCIPLTKNIQINYTNGSIDFDAGTVKVFGARETFDKNGFFAYPPLIYKKVIDENTLYLESLKKSCQFFIDRVYNKKAINPRYFTQSIISNNAYLCATKK